MLRFDNSCSFQIYYLTVLPFPIMNIMSTDKCGQDGGLNIKQKLSKFKFLECTKEQGPPSKFATQTKKINLQNLSVKVKSTLITDRTVDISTNEKPDQQNEARPE